MANIIVYTLKFLLDGFKKPFEYLVKKEEYERILDVFQSEDRAASFFEFDTVDGKWILIHRKRVLRCQFLWDARSEEVVQEAIKIEFNESVDWEVSFYLSGMNDPLIYDGIENSEAEVIHSSLLLDAFDENTYIGFTDEDAERNFLRAKSVVALEMRDMALTFEQDADL